MTDESPKADVVSLFCEACGLNPGMFHVCRRVPGHPDVFRICGSCASIRNSQFAHLYLSRTVVQKRQFIDRHLVSPWTRYLTASGRAILPHRGACDPSWTPDPALARAFWIREPDGVTYVEAVRDLRKIAFLYGVRLEHDRWFADDDPVEILPQAEIDAVCLRLLSLSLGEGSPISFGVGRRPHAIARHGLASSVAAAK